MEHIEVDTVTVIGNLVMKDATIVLAVKLGARSVRLLCHLRQYIGRLHIMPEKTSPDSHLKVAKALNGLKQCLLERVTVNVLKESVADTHSSRITPVMICQKYFCYIVKMVPVILFQICYFLAVYIFT